MDKHDNHYEYLGLPVAASHHEVYAALEDLIRQANALSYTSPERARELSPAECDVDSVHEIRVLQTILGGEPVYAARALDGCAARCSRSTTTTSGVA